MVAEGDAAPGFSLPDQDGKLVKLSSFKNKKKVVLYFYPRDMTPGCTVEACDFRDRFASIEDAVVLGVSADSPEMHRKFIAKYNLPFTLLADEEREAIDAYGVWQEKTLYGKKTMGIVRATFLIDKKGIVRKVYPKVKVEGHVEEVLAALQEI